MDKLIEGQDYALVPASAVENDQAWDVRILEGDFAETVIRFGNIAFNGETDCLTFNFVIVSTPDGELTTESVELQNRAADILACILEEAAASGSLVLGDPEETSED